MTCSIEGCEKPGHAGRCWCWAHYNRWRRNGDPLVIRPPNHGNAGRPPSGSRNPAWRGDDVSSSGVHWRLRAQRGPASAHACAECGEPAREWAFDESTGFSTDLTRYRPLCIPCHRRHDGVFGRAPAA